MEGTAKVSASSVDGPTGRACAPQWRPRIARGLPGAQAVHGHHHAPQDNGRRERSHMDFAARSGSIAGAQAGPGSATTRTALHPAVGEVTSEYRPGRSFMGFLKQEPGWRYGCWRSTRPRTPTTGSSCPTPSTPTTSASTSATGRRRTVYPIKSARQMPRRQGRASRAHALHLRLDPRGRHRRPPSAGRRSRRARPSACPKPGRSPKSSWTSIDHRQVATST
jgi:hypothetical protein